ncbi:MAG: FHA domain-containing protein, partial [Clostridiales bacterium]|nr:FHA domain-containing protein [Clostridiales bacterium]
IVFSDGADSNDTGVTINELYSLLQKSPYPIYAIGSEYNSNADKLKELFSISRITNANYSSFTSESNLDEVEKVIDPIDNYSRIEVTAPKELQDGSIKNIRLEIETLDGAYTLSGDVRMNMHINKSDDESIHIEDLIKDTEDVEDAQDDALGHASDDEIEKSEDITYAADNKKSKNPMFGDSKPVGLMDKLIAKIKDIPSIMYVFVALATIVLILIIIVLISSRNKNKKNNNNNNNNNNINHNMGVNPIMDSDNRTEMLVNPAEQKNTGTQYLFAPESKTRIKLKDLTNNQIFEKYLDSLITIGRLKEKNVIAITKESSVSGQHCKIYLQGSDVYIEDNNSSNHTYVGDTRIDKPTIIRTGDIITLGRIKLEVTIYN